jgi:hypothetical protein
MNVRVPLALMIGMTACVTYEPQPVVWAMAPLAQGTFACTGTDCTTGPSRIVGTADSGFEATCTADANAPCSATFTMEFAPSFGAGLAFDVTPHVSVPSPHVDARIGCALQWGDSQRGLFNSAELNVIQDDALWSTLDYTIVLDGTPNNPFDSYGFYQELSPPLAGWNATPLHVQLRALVGAREPNFFGSVSETQNRTLGALEERKSPALDGSTPPISVDRVRVSCGVKASGADKAVTVGATIRNIRYEIGR